MENISDHDLLIEVITKLDRLILDHDNHIHHHWMTNVALLSVTLMSAATTLIAVIIK